MCLCDRKEVNIKKKKAWKIFAFNTTFNTLESAFNSARKHFKPLSYSLNSKIEAKPFDSSFFSFEKFEDAVCIIDHREEWNIVQCPLIVLPVMLYNVTHIGKLPNSHFLSSHFLAFESKEIIILSGEESRCKTYHDFSNDQMKLFSYVFNVNLNRNNVFPRIMENLV